MLYKLAAKLAVFKQDRGEGPVPYIILVAVVVGVAVAVGTAVSGLATSWIENLEQDSNQP